jgi:hypothetical protein
VCERSSSSWRFLSHTPTDNVHRAHRAVHILCRSYKTDRKFRSQQLLLFVSVSVLSIYHCLWRRQIVAPCHGTDNPSGK